MRKYHVLTKVSYICITLTLIYTFLSDPRGWSKEDVTTWVDFTVQNNGLPNPNERFSILYPLQTFSPILTFLFLHKLLLKLIFLAPTGAL